MRRIEDDSKVVAHGDKELTGLGGKKFNFGMNKFEMVGGHPRAVTESA